MTIKDFKVGQTVFIIGSSRRECKMRDDVREAEVVKVGRKYVTISGHWHQKFEETGTSAPYLTEHTDRGAPQQLFLSRKAIDEYTEQEALKEWVQKATRWENIGRYTLNQLRAVKKILEEEQE